ncbi:MAG: hypothetical protein ACJ790_13725 [Myxococcaceae bacterium]
MRAPCSMSLCLAALLLLAGCPDKTSGADKAEQDHTLAKLKEAQEQQPKNGMGGPKAQDEEREKLANLAAAGKTDEGGPRPLPTENPTVHLGTVALKLAGIQTSPIVSSGKLSLSTDQTFLLLKIAAQNVGDKDAQLDLSGATVTSKTGDLPLARDAQHVAGTKDLLLKFAPAKAEDRKDLILIFELPPSDVGSGLSLNLTSPTGEKVKLPLE